MSIRWKSGLKCLMLTAILILYLSLLYDHGSRMTRLYYLTINLFSSFLLFGIFSIVWHRRHYQQHKMWIILSYGAISVMTLTLLQVFLDLELLTIGTYDGELSEMAWVCARFFEGLTIFLAVAFNQTKKRIHHVIGFGVILFMALNFTYILFNNDLLSPFEAIKGWPQNHKYWVMGVTIVYIIALFLILKARKEKVKIYMLLVVSLVLILFGEISYIMRRSVHDFSLSSHVLLLLAHALVYMEALNIRMDANDYRLPVLKEVSNIVDFEMAIASSSNGILLTDSQGIITYVNPAIQDRYAIESMLGMSIWDYVDDRLRTTIKTELAQNGHFTGELILTHNDQLLIRPFATVERFTNGYLLFLFELPEHAMADEKLIQEKEKAEASNEAKSKFLAHMSHEIRTPLNGITGFIKLLEHTPLTLEQSDFLHNIKVSTDTLLNIVNEILDLSKIEAGKMELNPTPFNFRLVVHRSVNLYMAKAKEKNIDLIVDIDQAIPPFLKGDTTRLKQILMNFTNNALKFTEQGFIKVETKYLGHYRVQFTIQDTGIGLSEEARKHILEPYMQIESSHKYGAGTGLGLSICKSLIELMGGMLEIESEEGKGTSFRFSLQFEAVNPEELFDFVQKRNLFEPSKKYPHAKVLLVEDDEISKKFFKLLIESKGIQCDNAENGQEAIEKWQENEYDIIFMDCHMPILDGYEATRQIRLREEEGKHTVIVALTASAMKGDAEKCFNAGMDEYISKPIQLAKLLRILDKYLVPSGDSQS